MFRGWGLRVRVLLGGIIRGWRGGEWEVGGMGGKLGRWVMGWRMRKKGLLGW